MADGDSVTVHVINGKWNRSGWKKTPVLIIIYI